jgi:peptidoglycan DL-endopeptidase CwlO
MIKTLTVMKAIKQTAQTLSRRVLLMLTAAMMAVLMPVAMVQADFYDDQIREIEQEVASFQDQAAKLRAQADTLQNKLNILRAEMASLQKQIDLNTTKLGQLKQKIAETEKKIAQQQKVLGENLVNIYLDSTVTPLEVLASANSIGDYIDKQEYRDTIRQQLQESIVLVKQLKEDLNKQRLAVEQTLADQKAQRTDLAAKQKQQNDLLARTRGQEAEYRQLAAENNARITDLREQQRIANLKWGGNVSYGANCGGGYSGPWPHWCNSPLDAYGDNWGMYTRECVSYTAFKVWASGRHMPYGLGNANMWPGRARAHNIPVDRTPKAGDVAVWPIGYYGHTMYVEAVRGNGDLYISEYNYDWTGRYSERTISRSTWEAQGFVFIHF